MVLHGPISASAAEIAVSQRLLDAHKNLLETCVLRRTGDGMLYVAHPSIPCVVDLANARYAPLPLSVLRRGNTFFGQPEASASRTFGSMWNGGPDLTPAVQEPGPVAESAVPPPAPGNDESAPPAGSGASSPSSDLTDLDEIEARLAPSSDVPVVPLSGSTVPPAAPPTDLPATADPANIGSSVAPAVVGTTCPTPHAPAPMQPPPAPQSTWTAQFSIGAPTSQNPRTSRFPRFAHSVITQQNPATTQAHRVGRIHRAHGGEKGSIHSSRISTLPCPRTRGGSSADYYLVPECVFEVCENCQKSSLVEQILVTLSSHFSPMLA